MKPRSPRLGFTFVELISAIAVLAIAIVPATKYLTDSLVLRRDLELRRILVRLAVETIERQMALVNGSFTPTPVGLPDTGTLAEKGFPELAYEIVRSDAEADGGIEGLLMAITVRVWSDDNGNGSVDSGETVVDLHTKMARSLET